MSATPCTLSSLMTEMWQKRKFFRFFSSLIYEKSMTEFFLNIYCKVLNNKKLTYYFFILQYLDHNQKISLFHIFLSLNLRVCRVWAPSKIFSDRIIQALWLGCTIFWLNQGFKVHLICMCRIQKLLINTCYISK